MVRGFGALLVIGIFVALACALTAGFAALIRFSERRTDVPPVLPRLRSRAAKGWDAIATSPPGEWIARVGDRLGAWGRRAVDLALTRPRRVLMIGLAVAALGWVADTQTEVISDVRELVPRDLQALKDVNELQEATGVSGEIDVTLTGEDLTDPNVIAWMTEFQREVLDAHGYKVGATCAQDNDPPELCPALSLPDLFRSGPPDQQQSVRALLDAVPPYFSQAVITEDRTTATLAFGIRLMPLDRQKEVIDDIEDRLDPPAGVEAAVVGLPVLAAQANDTLADPLRRFLTLLAGLLLVFAVLFAVRRSTREAAIPLIPIALATGWSALVLFLLRIPLNPMSAVMGALVIAISTEFSVLLSARYREERQGGAEPDEAIAATYASTGAAVLASGVTAIMGFAALIASDIRMLRDFGVVTVVDLTVSLLGVMVVLPAALVWAERRQFGLRDLDPRGWWRALREELSGVRLPRPTLPRPRLPWPRRSRA
jgi:predicted RND superfamily exporter protein